MDNREYAEELYTELAQRVDAGEVGDAWGDDLLLEFYDLVCELYPGSSEEPEWVFMFLQLYNWQFQCFHEGIRTFYTNSYGVDTDNGIRRMSDCLYRHGYVELTKWYDYGIFDYNLYSDFDYPAAYELRMEEIDEWISENVDMIWQIYVELLLEHKDEILKAAAHWEPDCDTKVEEQKDKEDSPALEVQKKEELTFQFFINLRTSGSTTDGNISWLGGDISCLTASHIDDKMVSQMVAAKELERIQTTEVFPKEALRFLDEKLFSVREDIMFRIYDLQNGDLRHFAEIIHIRKLSLDSMEDIGHIEVLSRFTDLTELYMRLPKRRDFSFVNKLSLGLTKLSLCVDFSQEGVTFGNVSDEKINGLYTMEWLLRFPKLESFYIGDCTQHIELLIQQDSVRELILYEIPCPPLKVLRMLDVQSVIIHQKYAQGLDRLSHIESIQEIQLVRVADINNLNFLETLPALQKLTLHSLPELSSFPHFPEEQKLQELTVYDCDKLFDISVASEKIFIRKYS